MFCLLGCLLKCSIKELERKFTHLVHYYKDDSASEADVSLPSQDVGSYTSVVYYCLCSQVLCCLLNTMCCTEMVMTKWSG